jgi:transposase
MFGIMLERYAKRKVKRVETRRVAGVDVVSNVFEFIGNMPLLIPIIEKLGLGELVDHFCPMERENADCLTHGEVFEMAVYNRLTSPRPLYRIDAWGCQYALESLFGVKAEKLNDDRIARTLETVWEKIDEIQGALSLKMMRAFGISADTVHYDITSLSFEGQYEESDLVRFGYSRDRRPDLKQVNLGLDVTRDGGIPIWSTTLAGNKTDVTTVIENMNNLKKHVEMKDYLVIMDRGMVSGDNLHYLASRGVGFVASAPLTPRTVDLIISIPPDEFRPVAYTDRNEKDSIKAAGCELEFRTKEGIQVPVRGWLFESSLKIKRDVKSREKGIDSITSIFEEISGKLNTRKYKNRDYVVAQIEKRTGKKHARQLFWWEIFGEDDDLTLDFCLDEEALRKSEALDGKYVLATNRENWTADEVIAAYKCQHTVEWRFRHLKSRLKVSPLFLKKDERIAGLVFVTIVALMVYSLLEYLCKKAQVKFSAFLLLETFGGCCLSRLKFSNGESLNLAGDLTPFQENVLGQLKFPHPREYL